MSRLAPILSRRDELVDVKTAADHAGRSDKTIRLWCREYGIGRQSGVGATFEINLIALEMVLHGDFQALEMLRAGDRMAPEVRRYLDFIGLAA